MSTDRIPLKDINAVAKAFITKHREDNSYEAFASELLLSGSATIQTAVGEMTLIEAGAKPQGKWLIFRIKATGQIFKVEARPAPAGSPSGSWTTSIGHPK